MTNFAIPAPPVPTVPVEGGGLFPVRRVFCVGRNYEAHVREMGHDTREPPFFFSKPADGLVLPGRDVPYPSVTNDLHHEIELVVALKSGGKDIAVEDALSHVFGYAAGVDLTRRDLQAAAKKAGRPWESGKTFDDSAPISAIRPWSGEPPQGAIRLSVNGAVRQDAKVGDMIWNVAEIIAEASKLWALAAGDLIYTGTPEGVGALVRGDRVDGDVEGVGSLSFTVI